MELKESVSIIVDLPGREPLGITLMGPGYEEVYERIDNWMNGKSSLTGSADSDKGVALGKDLGPMAIVTYRD